MTVVPIFQCPSVTIFDMFDEKGIAVPHIEWRKSRTTTLVREGVGNADRHHCRFGSARPACYASSTRCAIRSSATGAGNSHHAKEFYALYYLVASATGSGPLHQESGSHGTSPAASRLATAVPQEPEGGARHDGGAELPVSRV